MLIFINLSTWTLLFSGFLRVGGKSTLEYRGQQTDEVILGYTGELGSG